MKVLVTGGLGFIGWPLTKLLVEAGHEVDVLTRGRDESPPAGAKLVVGDVRDADSMNNVIKAGRYTGVRHLAALTRGRESLEAPLAYWTVNVGGTLNLLRAIADLSPEPALRFVLASTNTVYGSQCEGALHEDLPPHPESPYAASKAAAERLVSDVADTGVISAAILRVFNAAGAVEGRPDRDPTRLIPNILRAARGELPALSINGDGSAKRDYTHVLDVAEAFRLALEAELKGTTTYNVGAGIGTSIADLVAAAEEVTGRQIPVRSLPPRPEPHTSIADPTRIKTEFGWRPSHSTVAEIIRSAWTAPNMTPRPSE